MIAAKVMGKSSHVFDAKAKAAELAKTKGGLQEIKQSALLAEEWDALPAGTKDQSLTNKNV